MPITRTVYSNVPSFPSSYYEATATLSASGQTELSIPAMQLDVGGRSFRSASVQTLDVEDADSWDSIDPTDYTDGANRAGLDVYLYACQPESGITPTFLLSANATYPSGYTASNSRKIGGFHGLCGSVGTISGHTLSGYLTGDILPQSVWCLKHRSSSGSNFGLFYIPPIQKWAGIYLMSGTSGAPTIVFGGTILDTITWFVSCDAARALNMRLPTDYEFGVLAEGSNQQTNIAGSADPVTVTAAVDTAGRRMISNYGVEDCAGVVWQWLDEQSYKFNAATEHTHTFSSISGDAGSYTSGNASADVVPAWSYKALPSGKGSLYTQGSHGTVKLRAGGDWIARAYCGSLSRGASNYPWAAVASIGFRAVCKGIKK